MRVVDGIHRLRAAILRGDEFVDVKFFDGTEADAFVMAVELNSTHGLPLSLADRKAAAARIMSTHPQWSDRRIARTVGLSANTVGAIRRRSTLQNEQLNARVGSDGRVRPCNGAEGRQLAGDLMRANPEASLREVAKAAGISPATASDVRARINRGEPPITSRQGIDVQVRKPAILAAGRAPVPSVVRADIVNSLTRDPSLRFTGAGKILLRSLRTCAVDAEQWARIIDAVPTHRQETVAGLARACAGMWQELADRLAERIENPSPPA
ncbi:hypothetical protein ACIHCQ_42790 [Streptomyces sp. NPDC052236]|uniref:hypothetical protein n=1 Tax=Streptomyces sp. NPDC052236 TaxID=3365686 RepID=UPI0037CDD99A